MASIFSESRDLAPCPWGWDDRRVPRELYIKLFVVHFTVIGAYGHLLHLRLEPRSLYSYLFMIACPIAGTSLVILPLIALAIQAIVCRGNKDIMKKSAGLLLGSIVLDDPAVSNRPENPTVTWPPAFSERISWRIIAALAVLSQCVISIWLFVRRTDHDAAALYDYRILELALLGLSVSLITIVHELLEPQCLAKVNYPRQLSWLIFFRPVFLRDKDPDPEGKFHFVISEILSAILEYLYTSLFLFLAGIAGFMPLATLEFVHLELFEMFTVQGGMWILQHAHYYFAFVGIFGWIFRSSIIGKEWRKNVAITIGYTIAVYLGALVFFCTILPIIIILYQAFFFLLYFVFFQPIVHGIQMHTLLSSDGNVPEYHQWTRCLTANAPNWDKIETFGLSPHCCPCPMAWKDPIGDYVWWLA